MRPRLLTNAHWCAVCWCVAAPGLADALILKSACMGYQWLASSKIRSDKDQRIEGPLTLDLSIFKGQMIFDSRQHTLLKCYNLVKSYYKGTVYY